MPISLHLVMNSFSAKGTPYRFNLIATDVQLITCLLKIGSAALNCVTNIFSMGIPRRFTHHDRLDNEINEKILFITLYVVFQ